MLSDLIADLLTRIRNAQKAGFPLVHVRGSKMVERVLAVMKAEGLIADFGKKEVTEDAKNGKVTAKDKNIITVHLKYYPNGLPVIQSCRRVSKSGRRVYIGVESVARVKCGLGVSIISTSEGVMSDKEARKKKIGGELIATLS